MTTPHTDISKNKTEDADQKNTTASTERDLEELEKAERAYRTCVIVSWTLPLLALLSFALIV